MNRIYKNVGLLFGLALLGSCSSGEKKAAEAPSQEVEVKEVMVAPVVAGEVEDIASYPCSIEAETTNNITSQSGGRLEHIYVEVGDRVRKGQLLASLDATQLNQVKVNLDQAQLNFDRVDELYKVGGVAKSNWDAAKSQLDVAKVQYSNLLQNTSLRSPIDGVVTARNYDAGDMTSLQLPIFVVERVSPVKLLLSISEKYLSKLRERMPVVVSLDAFPSETFAGYIYRVYPTVDAASHSVKVEVRVDNKDKRLRPGMYARAEINFGSEQGLLVPDKAVVSQLGSGERYVFRYENGVAKYQLVEVGKLVGDKYQILSGLKLGDQVITTGLNAITSGSKVSVAKGESTNTAE